MTRIFSGDGSKWLADLHKDEEQMKPPRHLSAMRQSRRDAAQQQQMNHLNHAKWEHEAQPKQPSWFFAVVIAGILIVAVFGQFGG